MASRIASSITRSRGAGAVVVAVLAIALGAAGCGSDSDAGGADEGTAAVNADLTKAEFVKEGDAICKRGGEEIRVEAIVFREEHGLDREAALSQKQKEEFVAEAVVPAVQEQADGLAELGAPEGDQSKVAAIVEGLEKVAEAGEEDPASILRVKGSKGPVGEVNLAAEQYDVGECTQP